MNTIDYIKQNCWCNFKNNNRTLFYRSIYHYGIQKYKNKRIKNKVTETFTIYYPENKKQIHGFNGNQPPIDKISLQKIPLSKLDNFIKQYYLIREKMEYNSQTIKKEKKFLDFSQVKRIIELEAKLYSYEYLISNLVNNTKETITKEQLEIFSKWKNNPQNKEPWIYNFIFEEILKTYSLSISLQTFKQYIHFKELLGLLKKKKDIHTIVYNIEKRKRYGFLLLNFHTSYNKIIINSNIVQNVIEHLEKKEKEEKEKKGIPTYPFPILEGECVVIQNNDFHNINIFNKIIVCSILTAQDVMNLLDSRAILVEYGGYLSHASIWSREYHKPCLVNCKNITKRLQTGNTIRINGENGSIELLQQKND